jgi:hypothetical protein
MAGSLFNYAVSKYLALRHTHLEQAISRAPQSQEKLLTLLLSEAASTEYGRQFGFSSIKTKHEFKARLPLVRYQDIVGYIEEMMKGKADVLWPGQLKYFAKSSGTTQQRSKYIPISNAYLRSNLIRSSWDTTAFIYHREPKAEIFRHKSLIMGGSLHHFPGNRDILVGDVSAIMIKTIPFIGRPFYTPDFDTALLGNWEEKIAKICQQCIEEKVVMFGGVPTWNIVLFNKILEYTGKNNILEVWPTLRFYLHGGVNFEPYRETFKKYIPSSDFHYIEAFNASEGYFAVQDTNDAGMRLLTDNGIYYEFLAVDDLHKEDAHLRTLDITEVTVGVDYAMVISNCSGLWRYVIGDTIKFTHAHPLKLEVTGRIEQYINAFGEEVMIGDTDKALSIALRELNLGIKEYTVAPCYLDGSHKGYHEWLIEFENAPANKEDFEQKLDEALRQINSDYDAKRSADLALERLKVHIAPKGLFHEWLKVKNRMGGQYKIPRLSNDRHHFNEIMGLQTQMSDPDHG